MSQGRALIQIKKHGDKFIAGTVSPSLFPPIWETFSFGMNFTHALQKSIVKGSQGPPYYIYIYVFMFTYYLYIYI